FPDAEAANGHIQVFEELFPLGQYFSYTFLRCEGCSGLVLKVEVRKTRDIKVASNGTAYLRRGAQNLPMQTLEQLKRLELDKGVTSFETETVDVDLDFVSNSVVLLQFILDVVPSAEPEPWLKKQILVRNVKPTVAAVLLFAEEPQAILPKRCGLKIYRYETRDAEGSRATLSFDPMTIEGCLYDQVYEAVSKTAEVVEGIHILGPTGLEPIRYPRETLHEIITNAVLHRDYSIASDIQVRIFDNRIEVESPGRLPGHITEENILDEQFARNGTIVRLINKFPNPPNKDVGEGLNTAFEAMRQLRLKAPLIKERENNVIVYIRHEPLASPEEAVLQYLETHEEINNRTARELTGITSENSMKEVFYRLRDRKLIERVPGKAGRSSAWRKRK
ncbi:MAG: ATP-dependent DNA helicase RecG, partial [Anaerolineales bacterium]